MGATSLYRPREGSIVFGVCAGLGRYFDVDAVIVRLIFMVLAFFGGLGVVLYVGLAILMPSERLAGREGWQVVGENLEELREGAAAASHAMGRSVRHEFRGGRRRQLLGLVIVALGTLTLLANLGLFWWVHWELIWPIVLIGLGILLLVRRPSERR